MSSFFSNANLSIYARPDRVAAVISSDKHKPPMSPLLLLLLPLLLATANGKTTAVAFVTAAAAAVRDDDGGGGGPSAPSSSPVPPATPPWPEQFHAVVITNLSAHGGGGGLQLIDLYYDWPRGRDLNIVRDQLSGEPQWNVEWTNGTAFLFDAASCATFQFDVGLLPPDWKSRAGAAYLGRDRVDGFDCHVWSNFVFARYYEDVATGRPVSWTFNGTYGLRPDAPSSVS